MQTADFHLLASLPLVVFESWANSSVCPVKAIPESFINCLLIGQVTIASNSPSKFTFSWQNYSGCNWLNATTAHRE